MDKLKPCPFCGNENIIFQTKEVEFYGQRYDGIKKIKFRAYCTCTKCHSRGKPVFAIIDDVYIRGWDTRMKEKLYPIAAEHWNRRTPQ